MDTKVFHKWFWPWQDGKEEAWLGEMARQGWHLVKPDFLGQYTFAAGTGRDMVFRMDFVGNSKRDASYLQLFQDTGWEHVGELAGWQYFRKPASLGNMPEIFTDNASKIAKYRRLLLALTIFLPIITTIFMSTRTSIFVNTANTNHDLAVTVIAFVASAVVLVYIVIAIGILWRINQLKKS